MKVCVFTSNHPRHLALIGSLAEVADEVFAVQECTTVFPGEVDDFFRRSEVMQRYFSRVISSERQVFGIPHFLPKNVRQLVLKMGDVSRLPLTALEHALEADVIVVFGASYIRGELAESLIARQAVNIHMGISPFYRGSSCNFWAMYDGRPEYVGATIHRLSSGLDSGEILFHAFPANIDPDPFVYGMESVRSAQLGLCRHLAAGDLLDLPAIEQDRSLELRYTRNRDFTDAVAADYLDHLPDPDEVRQAIARRDQTHLISPFIG